MWTVSGGADYAGKPRPVVIIQDDAFDATNSITICVFTTDETEAPLFRLPVLPAQRKGRLDPVDIIRLNQALLVFLGLATSPNPRRRP